MGSGRIYPAMQVQGVILAGKRPDDGERLLRSQFADYEKHPVTFAFEGKSWTPSLADLGIAIDYGAILSRAMAEGRSGSVVDRYRTFLAPGEEREVGLVFDANRVDLDAYLAQLARSIDIKPSNAGLKRVDEIVDIEGCVAGRTLDRGHVTEETLRRVFAGEGGVIHLVPPRRLHRTSPRKT